MSRKSGKNQSLDIDSKTQAVFTRKNYHILNKLGAGAFGTVNYYYYYLY